MTSLSTALKTRIKDTSAEPVLRWLAKRSRGIHMPFDLVKNEIYDRQAGDVMSRVLRPESNCVDVGCHEGQYIREFLRYAPLGQHVAFEPIPALAASLRRRFSSVRVVEAAASDRTGEASFFVVPAAPARSGLQRREFISQDGARQEIRVRTERLDASLPAGSKVDFIKIDVEGAEGLVLAGAAATIVRDRPYIVFEHGRRSSLAFGVTSAQIYETLVDRCGLRLSRLTDWLNCRAPLTQAAFVSSQEWYFLAHPPR